MRTFWLVALSAIVTGVLASAADWPMTGGGPQRNGWARSERLLDKADVGTLTLLYKVRADNPSRGLNSLSAPIINGNLITYRGFKEMLIFGGSSDKVFSVDADLNQPLWEARMEYRGDKVPANTPSAHCLGGSAPPVLMAGNSSALMHFASEASHTPAAAGVKAQRRSPYFPPLPQSVFPLRPTTLTQLAALYTISSDGNLHVLNSSTGKDLIPAVKFVPPNAKVTSLNVWENVIYATTGDNCDGYRNALFAMDLLSREKKVDIRAAGWRLFRYRRHCNRKGRNRLRRNNVRARRCRWVSARNRRCSHSEGSEGEGLLHARQEAHKQEQR